MLKIEKLEYKLFFLFAVVSSMNGLMIAGFTLSNYIIILCTFIAFAKKNFRISMPKNKASAFITLFFISICLSILCSITILPGTWVKNSFRCLFKYVLLFGYVFWIHSGKEQFDLRKLFYDGFYIGAIIQLIWGFAQIILYYLFSFKLNTFIFNQILGMTQYSWDNYVGGGFLRMKGIGWEAANFALAMIIGYCLAERYKYQIVMKSLFAFATLLSTSRSGYIALACVIIYQLILNIKSDKKRINISRAIQSATIIIIGLLLVIILGERLVYRANRIISSMSNLFDLSDSYSSSSIHIMYYLKLVDILKKCSIINILFGNGYFSSGYIYSNIVPIMADRLSLVGWNPETDFVTLIIGNGLLGFLIYYVYAIKGFLCNRRNDIGLTVISVITCGITYLTIRGTWSFLLIAFSLLEGNLHYKVKNEKRWMKIPLQR